jgi:hypothetical protein
MVRWRDRSRLTTNEPTMAVYLWARFESLPPSIVPDPKNLSPELIYVGENELIAHLLRDQRHQRLLVYRATFPDDPDFDLLFVSVAAVAPFRPQERNCRTETEHGKASADPLVVTMRRTGPRWQLTSDTKASWRQCSPSINGRIVNVESGQRAYRNLFLRRRAMTRHRSPIAMCQSSVGNTRIERRAFTSCVDVERRRVQDRAQAWRCATGSTPIAAARTRRDAPRFASTPGS